MAVDIKLFAPVARATNAIYLYVQPDENLSAITAANYFDSKDLSGSVKKGDVVIVNAKDKAAILKVTAVDPNAGTVTVAKALAEAMFGSEDNMIRVDMSEFMEKHSTAKLIGSPPGYVGYDDGGHLSELVRKKPYSVVLFDEIEKAHPDVFNIMLQILDDGRLTDSKGRHISFKNTVIIMTSNVGASMITNSSKLGFTTAEDESKSKYEKLKDTVSEEMKKAFRPEFLNRIDETIVFSHLSKEEIRQIVDLMLKDLFKRLAEKELNIEVSDEVKDHLAECGYSEAYGARPLRRLIQRKMEDSLAEEILSGKYVKGDTIKVTLVDGKISFEKASKAKKTKKADQVEEPAAN